MPAVRLDRFPGRLSGGFRGEDAGELHLPPSKPSFANFIEMEVDLENPYCTEFIVKEAEVKEDVVRSTLQPLGNSLIVAVVGDIVKVHIHTKAPGLVLQHGLSWGSCTISRSTIWPSSISIALSVRRRRSTVWLYCRWRPGTVLPASCISSVQLRSSAAGRA